jgi:A/G-specific adenine glycosylase
MTVEKLEADYHLQLMNTTTLPPSEHPSFAERLIHWQRQHGRHDLPWQNTRDAYRIWLSEIMLQQTQVASVIPYYQRFLAHFPTLATLAAASVEEVMPLWSGLGYYARARNLHRCAQEIMQRHAGVFPCDPALLAQLPGIGRSTANAIAVFACGIRAPILDGNVKRVLCRSFGVDGFPGAAAVEQQLWQLASDLLPAQASDCATYIQAQMDLGATICTRSKPICAACPLHDVCVAQREERIRELPRSRPRKPLPQRSVQVLLLHDGEHWLLEQRPPQGIWGGLLSLPEVAVGDDASSRLLALAGAIPALRPLAPLQHNFTHFQLTLQPLLATVKTQHRIGEADCYRWLRTEELADAALPTPIRKIMQTAIAALAQEND